MKTFREFKESYILSTEKEAERKKQFEIRNSSRDAMHSLLTKYNPKLNHNNPADRLYQLNVRDTENKMSPEDRDVYEKHRKLHNDTFDAVKKIDDPNNSFKNNRPIWDQDRHSGL